MLTASNQSGFAFTGDPGEVVHHLWVDDAGGYADIYYAMGDFPLAGSSIIDEPNTVQIRPAIAVKGTGETVKVFACWQDGRYVNYGDDADIFFAETASSFGTNILVNDDAAGNTQAKPAIGIDKNGNPYIVWVDDRNGNNDIYYAGATAINVLETVIVDDGSEVTVQVPSVGNLQVTIPAGALPDRVDANNITIAEVLNPPAPPSGGFGVCYDFGPSGLVFSQPVTVTISHAAADCPGYSTYVVYWYNLETATWSQAGITNVQHQGTSDPHTVSCQATHFTTFAGGGSTAAAPSGGGGGGGGGGGCSLSPNRQGNIGEFLLPYIAFVIVLLVISWIDARRRNTRRNG